MAYAQWVTISIYPSNYRATLKNVSHSWGKFYRDKKDDEIAPGDIEGHVIESGQSYTISACGRSDASSGTEGSFDIYDGNVKVGTYTWDCPWGSKDNSSQWNPSGPNPPLNNYNTQQTGANLYSGALGDITIVTTKIR
jgi:hypothetical protein